MEKKILNMLGEIRPEFDFASSKDFVEDGYLDSFDVVTLVSEIEGEFDIVIDALDILPENFSSVSSICDLIQKNGGNL